MAFSQELQQDLDYMEQVYCGLDDPFPLKGELLCYPVLVKDYYRFYNCYGCITMDKTIKTIQDEFGRPKKVSNPKGIGQSYLEYLVDRMQEKEIGPIITAQLMDLFELVFHIKKGMYCPVCGETVSYETTFTKMNEAIEKAKREVQEIYKDALMAQESKSGSKTSTYELPEEIVEKVVQQAKYEFLTKSNVCPKCGEKMKDVFSIKQEKGRVLLEIRGTQLDSVEFDKFKAVVPRQNILDYDGDKYLDPDLKEELELKAKMQNKDYTSPTLEKQIVCVAIGTGYTLEYLKTIPMRKLSMFLRLVDREKTYYAQLQASMSGMVTFKEDPKHWIFSDDKKNIKDELTSLDNFEKKFEQVV